MARNGTRSSLAAPHVISDTMPPTEQVDGKFYESKRAFRAKGRELGLTEVGDQNLNRKPKGYLPAGRGAVDAVHKAIAEWHAGRRPRC
jgi:hypothetical protein